MILMGDEYNYSMINGLFLPDDSLEMAAQSSLSGLVVPCV